MTRMSEIRLSGELIAESTGGSLIYGPGLYAENGASIDTRSIEPRQVFFALKGPRFDAHDYLVLAVTAGAAGLVVSRDRGQSALEAAALAPNQVFVVVVDDTAIALEATAREWVSIINPLVIAITGSVGKTTSKNMTASVCARAGTTLATAGNLNNILGLSLTCLRLVPSHEILVLEMGMNARGEIARLCTIARPVIAIVTNVAPVHVEGLGSLEAIAEAKAELIDALSVNGIAILNADDPRVSAMASRAPGRVIRYGYAENSDVRIVDVRLGSDARPTATMVVGDVRFDVRIGLVGAHQVINAATAMSVALAVNLDLATAALALEDVAPGKHRMSILSVGTIRLIDDCYNASPKSMTAALEVLQATAVLGKSVAIVGDMLELGEMTESAHLQLGREIAASGARCVIAVGKQADKVRAGAVSAGMSDSMIFVAPDALVATRVAVEIVQPRETILIKGSRGIGLEKVVDGLLARFKTDGDSTEN